MWVADDVHVRRPLHVEVHMKPNSTARVPDVAKAVASMLQEHEGDLTTLAGRVDLTWAPKGTHRVLDRHVQRIDVEESRPGLVVDTNMTPVIHVVRMNNDDVAEEVTDEEISAFQAWSLPATHFQGLWNSLVYDEDIKFRLLDYVETALQFSDCHVSSDIIAWNRVVLLHGPPGTGKTSLCKALAQKISIRLSSRFDSGQLVEVNAHSLFSKWFSESGKLVMKMFARIRELAEDSDCFVCVLIDEVESLTAARQAAATGSEPSDAIRVVNALLTQLDQLRAFPNVLVMTTSNITGAIDVAFVDRADIKQYVGYPGVGATYRILASCAKELMRVGFISPAVRLLTYDSLRLLCADEGESSPTQADDTNTCGNGAQASIIDCSKALANLCSTHCGGLSGRALRKLPFLAHARHLSGAKSYPMTEFVRALELTVREEQCSRHDMDPNRQKSQQ